MWKLFPTAAYTPGLVLQCGKTFAVTWKRRLEHLVTQRDDIVAARNSLQQSVHELDTVARERFIATFGGARANFQRVFETLFGGGSCDVFLVDESDPLESEIEIVAKPRGKRTERIHLLSQGERSLVALCGKIKGDKPNLQLCSALLR